MCVAARECGTSDYLLVVKHLETLSPEELAELAAQRQATKEERREQKQAQAANKAAALASPYSVVIDCAFGELMVRFCSCTRPLPSAPAMTSLTAQGTGENKSLMQQFAICYASNARAAVPARLCFTGLGGDLAERYDRYSGTDKWPVVRSGGSYLDVFAERRQSLVYLTADSPHELAELRADDVYIIGGIVDRNKHKGVTLKKAEQEGIRHARLPLQANMRLTGSAVLTVNQVLDILLAWLELRDWRAACERAVPPRKRAAEGEAERLGRKARRSGKSAAAAAAGREADVPAPQEDDDDGEEEEEAAEQDAE